MLTAYTADELRQRAQQEAQAHAAERARAAAERRAAERAATERDVRARADAIVGQFELGQDAHRAMAGMRDLFGEERGA